MPKRKLKSLPEIRCMMKRAYVSPRIAEIKADELTAQRGVKLWAYQCPHCKKWHHTSSKPWSRKIKEVRV
jgi:hypothetical protein